jgi:hypothetical protein
MFLELIVILSAITTIILCSLKLFTHVFDNFNDIYTNCEELDSNGCVNNVNCRLYNVGGNRNTSEKCAQSAVVTGAIGNPNVLQ